MWWRVDGRARAGSLIGLPRSCQPAGPNPTGRPQTDCSDRNRSPNPNRTRPQTQVATTTTTRPTPPKKQSGSLAGSSSNVERSATICTRSSGSRTVPICACMPKRSSSCGRSSPSSGLPVVVCFGCCCVVVVGGGNELCVVSCCVGCVCCGSLFGGRVGAPRKRAARGAALWFTRSSSAPRLAAGRKPRAAPKESNAPQPTPHHSHQPPTPHPHHTNPYISSLVSRLLFLISLYRILSTLFIIITPLPSLPLSL